MSVADITLVSTGSTSDVVRGYNTTWDFSLDLTSQENVAIVPQATTQTNYDISIYLTNSDLSSITASNDGTSVVAGTTHSYLQTADISSQQTQQALDAGATITITGQVSVSANIIASLHGTWHDSCNCKDTV